MLLGLILVSPSVWAFAPSNDQWQGSEPNRIYRYHDGVQTRLRHTPEWGAFTAGLGAGWFARFDERTGTPHVAWGPPIPLADTSSSQAVADSVQAILSASGLAGVDAADLKPRNVRYAADTDTWYVDFDRLVDGYPIWQGGVSARVRFDALFLLQVDTYPGLGDIGSPRLDAQDALLAAELGGPAPMGRHTDESTRLVILPWEGGGPLEMRLVYEVRSFTEAPLGRWVSFVDAQTGALLNVYNDIRFLSGTVYGTHRTRTVDGSYTTSALSFVTLEGSGGGTTDALEDGSFTVSDAESWSMALAGSYVYVRNRDGTGNGSLGVSDSAPTWTTADATQAEIDSYRFLHDVRLWSLAVDPTNQMGLDRLASNVNLNSYCNAYYDGAVNFYDAGGSCNNTGEIADVNYHEWGHGFHYYALQSGSYDSAVSEGAGDTVSTFITKDSDIAPYFYTNGRPIRQVASDRVYPEDISGDPHETGLIWAGAVWDTWEELLGTYGELRADEGDAWLTVGRDFAIALRSGPQIDETYDEFSAADDDDGDLSNGTPHGCEIIDGFALHGLGPSGTATLVGLNHQPLSNQPADVPIDVDGGLLNLAPDCVSAVLDGARIVWTTDLGAKWTETELDFEGTTFSGQLPGLPEGTIVWYYITAVTADGAEVNLPATGDIAPYSFYVGPLIELYCEDFEAGDGGYTHELLSGRDQEGADDWQWGSPSGEGGDPVAAWSGSKVWGNDLGAGNYNGEYQSGVVNRLTSSPIDVLGNRTVVVQFRRWLEVQDGFYDDAILYANDLPIWQNHATNRNIGDEDTVDSDWMLHTVRLDDLTGALSLAWEIDSGEDGRQYGGWTLDDVCVYALSDVQSAFTIEDFVASDDRTESVHLSFTQPVDPRASDVVIRRGAKAFPLTRDEGEPVYTGEAAPGAKVEVDDPVSGTFYYSVFAGGETGWFTGVTEGANADLGTGLPPVDTGTPTGETPDPSKVTVGCGCSSPGGAGLGVWGLLVAVGLLRSRRR